MKNVFRYLSVWGKRTHHISAQSSENLI